MGNIEAIITYIVSNFPRPISRFELVKVVYCFEYYYHLTTKSNFTGVEFIRDNYGPFTWEIPEAVERLEGIVACEAYTTYFGSTGYRHNILSWERAVTLTSSLPDAAKIIADCTIELLKNKNLSEIKQVAYNTPPMDKVLLEEKNKGILYGRGINMSERKPIFKATRAELEAARAKRNKVSRGTDEEYYKNLLKESEQYEELRRRANKWLLV